MAAHNRSIVECASALCPPFRGRHTQGCLDEVGTKCDGCLPRLAADGLRLCQLCARLLAEDPVTLAGRYAALGLVLAGGGRGAGVHVAVSRDPNMQLNAAAAEARAQIRAELIALVRLVVGERGVHVPVRRVVARRPVGFVGPMPLVSFVDSSVEALAFFLGKHAEWLAAHRAAGEHAEVLRQLVRGSFVVAYPNGTRLFPVRIPRPRGVASVVWPGVASCPASVRERVAFSVSRRGVASEVLGEVPCSGSLWTVLRPLDDRLPAELLCNAVVGHRWPVREWLRLGARLAGLVAESVAAARAEVEVVERSRSVSGVRVRMLPGRSVDVQLADFERMDAATVREVSGRGFVVRCRACVGSVPVGVDPPEYSLVSTVEWGVPVEALLWSWGRHVCPEGTVAA